MFGQLRSGGQSKRSMARDKKTLKRWYVGYVRRMEMRRSGLTAVDALALANLLCAVPVNFNLLLRDSRGGQDL